jgi:hypothetical protein
MILLPDVTAFGVLAVSHDLLGADTGRAGGLGDLCAGDEAAVTPAVAPYFSLARAAWIPAVYAWDAPTGELRLVEGHRQAVEASRFLARAAT